MTIGRAQRAAARLYERLGARVMLLCMVFGIVGGVCAGVLAIVIEGRYLSFSSAQTLSLGEVWLPVIIALGLLGLMLARRQLRTILAWQEAGHRPSVAVDTWYATVTVPSVIWQTVGLATIAIPPGALYVVLHFHVRWYSAAPVAIVAAVAGLGTGAIAVSAVDLATRPMLEEIATYLPDGFAPRARGLRLRTRALVPLPIVALFAALLVGAYANASSNGTVRLTIAVGLALATIAVSTVIYLMVTRSLLAPIGDLLAATERVRAGDLSTPVPLVTADELGMLARSFNEMLANLEHGRDELRKSRERIVAAADAGRRRVERDLHDGAQQQLVLVRLKLSVAELLVATDPPGTRSLIEELRGDLDRALAELRDLAHGIYPALLDSEGLPGALRDAAERAAIPATFESDGASRYPHELEAAVYFCCLEALQNAAKHAGAGARATICLSEQLGILHFEVRDDGAGFDPGASGQTRGLQNMTDRIGALGGTLALRSAPGAGSKVAGAIPLARYR